MKNRHLKSRINLDTDSEQVQKDRDMGLKKNNKHAARQRNITKKGMYPAANLTGELKKAALFHRSGRLNEAEAAYKKILGTAPGHADTLNLLGLLYFQKKEYGAAQECIEMAIRINPSSPLYHINLGNAFNELNRAEEAADSFRQALSIQPDHAEALNNLGNALFIQGKMDEAVSYYKRAIELNGENTDIFINLAAALKAGDRPDEAVSTYKHALAIDPNRPDVYINLGNLFAGMGKNKDAISSYQKAIALDPDYPEAYNNLGNVLKQQGHAEEAIECYRKALDLKPDNPHALNNLGNALRSRGKLEEAVACYENALNTDPEYPEAYNNLGNALGDQGKMGKAILSFQKALEIRPDNVKTFNNLGGVLRKQGKLSEALEAYKKALNIEPGYAGACNNMAGVLLKQGKVANAIGSYQKALSLAPDYATAHSNLLLSFNYQVHTDPDWLVSQHRGWAARHSSAERDEQCFRIRSGPAERKLRIGYVSPDFKVHSVAYFFEAIIGKHDRSGFEIFCYSDVICPDRVTRRFSRNADCFRNIAGIENKTVADRIYRDKIDILVDLAGHTAGSRLCLFSMKPAPIQVAYLGYPNTTGLKSMDYRLTDALADPPGLTDHLYTEKLVRLPHGFLCYTPLEKSPEIGKTGNRNSDRVVFGSFNNRTKITPEVVNAWAKILTRVRNGKLVLKSGAFADPETGKRLIDLFSQNGARPGQIELVSHIPSLFDHLQLYNRIDIGLDTFPYNGTTTTCEALWMGVPVITLAGETHRSRVGCSLLSQVGLEGFIAESIEDYVKTGIDFAHDMEKLKSIQLGLRSRMARSSLMDSDRFTGSLEREYRLMFNKWLGVQGV